ARSLRRARRRRAMSLRADRDLAADHEEARLVAPTRTGERASRDLREILDERHDRERVSEMQVVAESRAQRESALRDGVAAVAAATAAEAGERRGRVGVPEKALEPEVACGRGIELEGGIVEPHADRCAGARPREVVRLETDPVPALEPDADLAVVGEAIL